jgi:hypothetical protein
MWSSWIDDIWMIQKKKEKKMDFDVVEFNVLNPLFADYFFPAVPVLNEFFVVDICAFIIK